VKAASSPLLCGLGVLVWALEGGLPPFWLADEMSGLSRLALHVGASALWTAALVLAAMVSVPPRPPPAQRCGAQPALGCLPAMACGGGVGWGLSLVCLSSLAYSLGEEGS